MKESGTMDLWESVANSSDAGWLGKTVSAVLGALCGGGASAYFCRLMLSKTVPDLTLAFREEMAQQRLSDRKESEANRKMFCDESRLDREQNARKSEIYRKDMNTLWRSVKEENTEQNKRIETIATHLQAAVMHLDRIQNQGCGLATKGDINER